MTHQTHFWSDDSDLSDDSHYRSNKNIENIGTRLDKTRLDENQITRSIDSSKRSEKYELGVKLYPEPLLSDSSESSSLDSRAQKKEAHEEEKAS